MEDLNQNATSLVAKFQNLTARVGVIGLGYVGLPLAVAMASAGFKVIGIDINQDRVQRLLAGDSYILDVDSQTLKTLVTQGRLTASTKYELIATLDAVSICVPTPLRKTKDPDISFIVEAIKGVAQYQRQTQLIILESTTYPGTTEEIVLPALARVGNQVGEDFFLAFSPERVDPGNPTFGTKNTPKIIGGITPACTSVATSFYHQFIASIIPVSSTKVAEMVKLLENTFRSVNIALVNEMALMCDRLKLDVWEVIDAATTKPFGFMPFYPGPGLGGHCIPIDPHYLSWKLKTLNYQARFIELAADINSTMPHHVLMKITDALNDHGKCIRGARILIIGVAYKRNIDDTRESPALDLIQLLLDRGADLAYTDPHVPHLAHGQWNLHAITPAPAALRTFDLGVIVTDHASFDYATMAANLPLIIDTRNATRRLIGPTNHIIKL